MKDNIQKACKEYEQKLLDAARYSGNKEPGKLIFSASSLGNTQLQNYLKFKYGSKDDKEFGANTFGSIYQLGVDKAFEHDPQYHNALRLKWKLSNGWIISGEMDQVDDVNKVIFDNKVTTTTTIGKVYKERLVHHYALQMAVYKWLLYKNFEKKYDTVLPMVDKSYSHFRENKYDQLTFVEVDTYSFEEIEQKLIDTTNELQNNIDLEIEPAQCSQKDLWFYKPKGATKAKPMRCLKYCDQSNNCPYFDSDHYDMNELMNL